MEEPADFCENIDSEWFSEKHADELLNSLEEFEISPSSGLLKIQELAQDGSALAMYLLGDIFLYGKGGLEVNFEDAEYWLEKSFLHGSNEGGFLYAKLLEEVGRDEKSIEIYRVLADRGFFPAAYCLGLRLFHGDGVPIDKTAGSRYLKIAKNKGHVPAWHWHSYLARTGKLGIFMIPAGIVEALHLAFHMVFRNNTFEYSDVYRQ
ncbi:MAG: tetratricopeptide repeat protein [Sphingomonadaceae bacterium]